MDNEKLTKMMNEIEENIINYTNLDKPNTSNLIVVKYKVKKLMRQIDPKMRFSDKSWDSLQFAIFDLVADALTRAKRNGRTTILPQDF